MKKEYILALASVTLWGTLSPVSKILLNNFPQMEVLFLTSAIGAIFLILLNIFKGNYKIIQKYKSIDYIFLFFLGFLGIFLYTAFYNNGISLLSSQEACIINYMWPIMIVIFSCFILKEAFTLRKLIAVIISFFGIVIIATKGNIHNISLNNMVGIFSCIFAAVSYGLFSAINKKKSYNQFIAMNIYYIITAICSGIILFISKSFVPIMSGTQILGILWLGIFTGAIAYLCWCLALVGGNTAKISNLAYLTPFISIIFGKIMLNENISIYAFIGLLFIILGIFIQINSPKKTA